MPTDPGQPNPSQSADAAGTALVPAAAMIERRSRRRWFRWAPDPIFVAHLIAQAEQVPQARYMRRASPADAEAAYKPHRVAPQGAGSRMRQVV
jgi:hypothetical protein